MSRGRSVPVAFAAGAALAAGVAVTPQFATATTKAATTVPLRTCTAANQPHFWGVATGPRFGDLGVWADLRPPRLPLSLGQ